MPSVPPRTAWWLLPALLAGCVEPRAALRDDFEKTVRPFLRTYCVSCHAGAKAKGDLDLAPFTSVEAVAKDPRRWELVLERLRAGDMPPKAAKDQPPGDLRREVIAWVEAVRKDEGERNAGDPGPVPARRLSNAEYNHTVRDLTGVDVRPTRDFPVDPANEAGFDNSAESLATSPALVRKYLEAARRVADHLVLTPTGLDFAPHPAVAETDRDKFAVNRILAFYKRQRTDLADYFLAARRGGPPGLSAPYVETVRTLLTGKAEESGPVAALQALWRELPDDEAGARKGCERMRDFVVDVRAKLVPAVKNLTAPKISNGSQPLVLWKNRQTAANRRRYAGGATVPAGSEAEYRRFCATFPDAFFVSERARVYLDPLKEKGLTGRHLSAGFQNQMGYFRDDGPLSELLLDDAGRRELDRLWQEFDFVTDAPVRQYLSFIWFERAESSYLRDPVFDAFRAEDKDSTSDAKMRRLEEAYLEKAERVGAGDAAVGAIHYYFRDMAAKFRWLEKARRDAEPLHLAALHRFAERAYRRPLNATERDGLTRFYRDLREKDGLGHEDAVRDAVVSVLMSPHFLFRADLAGPAGPLDGPALASRLSYFLWASLPDEELLRDPKPAQARRMLRDPRARGLATEFAANWLDVRRFEEHNAVDRGRFPAFDDALREAMFEEPVRFFQDLAARDGSVLDLLYADHTFVNAALAKHYGLPAPKEGWTRVDGVRAVGRGGLLPMAAFLTKNAPGLRTSPVKRGYWVARRLLGEHIPAPPPDVPDLPADETKLTLPLRDALARHRSDRACAGCHERFDSLGLVFEGYGPVGERRARDLGGRPVDARATFPGGTSGDGLDGLIAYVRAHRERDFIDNLCRKLLAFALNRGLLLSDEPLVRTMRERLAANEYRFSTLVECVVTSPQFLTRRGPAAKGETR